MKMIKSAILVQVIFMFVLTHNCMADDENHRETFGTIPAYMYELADESTDTIETLSESNSNNENVLEPQTSDDSLPLNITGFGDFSRTTLQSDKNYGIGQVEIDFEKNIANNISFIAAIAYSNDTETFGLGEFNVDFHLFGSNGEHFRHVSGIDHSGIKVGQFDVPFGLDWQVYPSIDRKTVTGPLAVENTHMEWNDYGVQAFMDNRWFSAAVYGLNGFGYDDVEMKFALGGRMVITPNEFIEIGGSYADFFNGKNKTDMSLAGVDLQVNYQALSLKGEYIAHMMDITGDNAINNSGFYCQGMYDFGRLFYVSRYGNFTPDVQGEDSITRFTNCIGFVIMEDCEIRYEYQINSENRNASFMQVAVGF